MAKRKRKMVRGSLNKKRNYEDWQKDILRTRKLPGKSLKAKISWGKAMNKLLGTNKTWRALLQQAMALRGLWLKKDAKKKFDEKKKVSAAPKKKSKKKRKSLEEVMAEQSNQSKDSEGSALKAEIIEIQDVEYAEHALMVNCEIVWTGDSKPEIFRFDRSKKIIVRISGEEDRVYSYGDSVEIGIKDLN